jgi:mannitol-specific phosphotransferase system IIBC component
VKWLKDRPTPDIVILGLTLVVCLAVMSTIIALVIAKIEDPNAQVADLAKQVGEFISSLIAVIVGYIGGRGVAGNQSRDDKTQ